MTDVLWLRVQAEVRRQRWPCAWDPQALRRLRRAIERAVAQAVRAGRIPQPDHASPQAVRALEDLRQAVQRVQASPGALRLLREGTLRAFRWPAPADAIEEAELVFATGPDTVLLRADPCRAKPDHRLQIVQADELLARLARAAEEGIQAAQVAPGRRPRQDVAELVAALAFIFAQYAGRAPSYTVSGPFAAFAGLVAETLGFGPDHNLARPLRAAVLRWRRLSGRPSRT